MNPLSENVMDDKVSIAQTIDRAVKRNPDSEIPVGII